MKPSNSKVIVLPGQAIWRGRPVDIAVPVGRRITPRALNWLQQFAQQPNRMLLYSEQYTAGVPRHPHSDLPSHFGYLMRMVSLIRPLSRVSAP